MRICPQCRSIFTGEGEFCTIDGTRLVDDAHDPLIGEHLDRYEFVERLGTGAMGVVYRVRHTELERDFAMKVLYGEFGANKSLVARFRREAKAMSKISHSNVVQVVDFGSTEHGLSFLVMEYIQGRTLEDLLEERQTLEPQHAAHLVRQVAAGLSEVHRLGFVHRDIKPANVMLTGVEGRENAKLLDFGIVGMADETGSTKLTGTGRIVGTPRYMSPEQARDSGVGPQADLYSLGCILYELVSGDVPFPGDVVADVLVMHSTIEPSPLPPSQGLEHIVKDLLAKRPEDRVQSAAELVHRLDRCFEDLASMPKGEEEIPTERPVTNDLVLEVPPLADEEEAVSSVAPFPNSGELKPLPRATSDISIYDSAPANFEDEAMQERPTSGFDAPGSPAADILSSPGIDVERPTYGGTSDHISAPDLPAQSKPRTRSYSVLATVSTLAFLALAVIVAIPMDDPPPAPAAAAAAAAVQAPPAVPTEPSLPYMVRLIADDQPLTAGVERKKVRRRRRRRPSAPKPEAPHLSVSELEVALGHVLARRSLVLADLSVLKSTRGLARAWRSARKDQGEAEAARLLSDLIEKARTVPLTRRLLVAKAKRVKRQLRKAQPSLDPSRFAELDRVRRAREFEARRSKAKDYDRVAADLTKLEQEITEALTSGE